MIPPGKHYVVQTRQGQAPEFDYYRNSHELKPESVLDGDRLLVYDTGRIYVYFRGEWHTEPDASRELISKLEEVRDELAKQTPTALALLEKL